MTVELSPTATQAAWDAELRLERVAAHEDVAEFFDAETVSAQRHQFAASYRRLVGVHPADRHEFRQALERIRDGGGMSVPDLIDVLNRR